MTNSHVLQTPKIAGQVIVEFNAESTIDNTPGTPAPYTLDPSFFITDAHIDFTLVSQDWPGRC